MAYTGSCAVNSAIARQQLQAEPDQLKQLVVLPLEEIRIKDTRMKRIAAQRGPKNAPVERMAILELRSVRAWSARQAARASINSKPEPTDALWQASMMEATTKPLIGTIVDAAYRVDVAVGDGGLGLVEAV